MDTSRLCKAMPKAQDIRHTARAGQRWGEVGGRVRDGLDDMGRAGQAHGLSYSTIIRNCKVTVHHTPNLPRSRGAEQQQNEDQICRPQWCDSLVVSCQPP